MTVTVHDTGTVVQCCGTGMFIPDPSFFHLGSGIRIKELKYFNPKKMVSNSIADPDQRSGAFLTPGSGIPNPYLNIPDPQHWFLSSRKYDPGCSSRIRILIFTLPGSRGQKGTGSRIRISNIGKVSNKNALVTLGT
jgi:hypothetical protein